MDLENKKSVLALFHITGRIQKEVIQLVAKKNSLPFDPVKIESMISKYQDSFYDTVTNFISSDQLLSDADYRFAILATMAKIEPKVSPEIEKLVKLVIADFHPYFTGFYGKTPTEFWNMLNTKNHDEIIKNVTHLFANFTDESKLIATLTQKEVLDELRKMPKLRLIPYILLKKTIQSYVHKFVSSLNEVLYNYKGSEKCI